jgi:nitroreductase
MCAPSAGNERPWHFIVITERSLLNSITEFHEHAQMLKQAPAAIIICADLTADRYPGANYWVQDCSAATENILLTATEKGLGSCWLGIYPIEKRIKGLTGLLGLPENVVPVSAIALGYPAETKNTGSRYDGSRVHRNHWG